MNKKRIWLSILILPVLAVFGLYMWYASLDVYTNNDNGTLSFGNRVFQTANNTYTGYYQDGERKFEIDKIIGKTNNSLFIGFKETVYKIKGKSSNQVIFLKGLMYEGVYERLQ
jgi:hypothetical protein